jgi:hypothetical protein
MEKKDHELVWNGGLVAYTLDPRLNTYLRYVFIPIPAAFHHFFLSLHWCIGVDRPSRADKIKNPAWQLGKN